MYAESTVSDGFRCNLSAPMSLHRDYANHVRAFSPNARRFLVANALFALGGALLGVTRNLYLKKAGYNEAEIGYFMSAVQLGTVVCVVPAALLLDRWRIKPILVLSVLVSMAGSAGTALLEGRLLIAAASFVAGAGGAAFGVAASPFYARNSQPAERGHLFGVSIGLTAFTGTLGTLAVDPLQRLLGTGQDALRTMMLTGSAGAVLAVLPIALLTDNAAVSAARRTLRDFLLARDWRTLLKLCIPDACIGAGAGLTIPFINLYFQDRFHKSPAQIAYYFAASSAMNMVGFFLAPAIAQRAGRVATIAGSQLLSIPFFAALAFTTSLPVAVAAFLLRSLLMNMSHPVNSAFVMDMAAADQQAVTNSLKQVSWNVCWAVSASAGGWMIHHVSWGRDGYSLPMVCTIGTYVVGSALFLIFWGGRRVALHPVSSSESGD